MWLKAAKGKIMARIPLLKNVLERNSVRPIKKKRSRYEPHPVRKKLAMNSTVIISTPAMTGPILSNFFWTVIMITLPFYTP